MMESDTDQTVKTLLLLLVDTEEQKSLEDNWTPF